MTPRIPDSEDEGDCRPALRMGRAPRLGYAPTGSSVSVRCRPAIHCMQSWRAKAHGMVVACCLGIIVFITIMCHRMHTARPWPPCILVLTWAYHAGGKLNYI